jgi:uncharacterized protein (DUF1015 family)
MADIRPFRGVRFDPKKAKLAAVLCPPYDVIDAVEAGRLRKEPKSAVHLELPAGEIPARYENAALTWSDWLAQGLLVQDDAPAFYVIEERFSFAGKSKRRLGMLTALGVSEASAKDVVAHERTLAKPKADRLELLKAVEANVSPIFGLFADPGGAARRVLQAAAKGKPLAAGKMKSGVAYKMWKLDEPRAVETLRRAVEPRKLLIADGHHRFEVSRAYYEMRPGPATDTVLAYVCPEEDPGLVALSTHRIVSGGLSDYAETCKVSPAASRAAMISKLERAKSPYAFGLLEKGRYSVAEPKTSNGCGSGLCVEWIGKHLLGSVPPDQIKYTPDAAKAVALAKPTGATVVFVKQFKVEQIRRAVAAVGLLPPKSTYFFPKIATGLVFKSLKP